METTQAHPNDNLIYCFTQYNLHNLIYCHVCDSRVYLLFTKYNFFLPAFATITSLQFISNTPSLTRQAGTPDDTYDVDVAFTSTETGNPATYTCIIHTLECPVQIHEEGMPCSPGNTVTFTGVPAGKTLVAIVRALDDYRIFNIERIFTTPSALDDCAITLINEGILVSSVLDFINMAVLVFQFNIQGTATGVMCRFDEGTAAPCELSLFNGAGN